MVVPVRERRTGGHAPEAPYCLVIGRDPFILSWYMATLHKPEGCSSVSPYLIVHDAAWCIDFVEPALDAKERLAIHGAHGELVTPRYASTTQSQTLHQTCLQQTRPFAYMFATWMRLTRSPCNTA